MKLIKGWSDWHVHPFTLFYIGCAFMVGYQERYFTILFIVCFHELGHYLVAKHYHFVINKVLILPFGAFLQLEDYGYHKNIEELLVLVAGLSMHILLLFVPNQEFQVMNRIVFLFNMIPIYPLDGSKILLLLFSYIMDYKNAIKLQIYLSIFSLSIFIITCYNYAYFIVFGYLFYQITVYSYHYPIYLQQFLIKRSSSIQSLPHKIHFKSIFLRPYHNYYYHNGVLVDEKHHYKELFKKARLKK